MGYSHRAAPYLTDLTPQKNVTRIFGLSASATIINLILVFPQKFFFFLLFSSVPVAA
jgi:hypothetical protein